MQNKTEYFILKIKDNGNDIVSNMIISHYFVYESVFSDKILFFKFYALQEGYIRRYFTYFKWKAKK